MSTSASAHRRAVRRRRHRARLDRTNKVRAGLTILGVAVGVFVVVVISAAIHGINASVAKDFESRRPDDVLPQPLPITFEACDGTDDTCKWRHNPPLTLRRRQGAQRAAVHPRRRVRSSR